LLLREGDTCWRAVRADRAALLIDMACYFEAAKAAMLKARRSIHFLNWAFEQDTLFSPQPGGDGPASDRIGNFLKALANANHDLDVRILCWKSAMPVAATQHFFPFADRRAFTGSRVRFVLDGKLPMGACHHQKMLIVDDAVGFCGGGDIGPDRWDTPEHLDNDTRRQKTRRDHKDFDSRHEVMSIVDGEAATALGGLFRDRWLRATGEAVPPPKGRRGSAWPACVTPDFRDVEVGLSRTLPAWRGDPSVREIENLHLAAIEGAREVIYMENQYFTSPVIAEALAKRLRARSGPEVILVSTEHSPSYFDQATMDKTRMDFVRHLKAADRHGRFGAYSPVTTLGRTIIVHAKLTIIDDELLRIGSANINNRSLGFDTECDLSIGASGDGAAPARARIAALRTRLLAHWLGCDDAVVEAARARAGGLIAALEDMRTHGYARLRPIEVGTMNLFSALVAKYHLGDPVGTRDAWRPWSRRQACGATWDRRG
jgi:phosphatidylserine/phosphatidylglycerophosphate/cardiolipin synthase-like enzyme